MPQSGSTLCSTLRNSTLSGLVPGMSWQMWKARSKSSCSPFSPPQIYQGLQNLQRTVLSSNEQSRQTIQQSMLDMERRLQNSQVLDAARLAAVSRTVRNCSEEVTRVLQAPPDSLAEPLLLPPVIASSSQPALETIPRYLLSIYVFV